MIKISKIQNVVSDRKVTPTIHLRTKRRVIGFSSILSTVAREKNKYQSTSRGQRFHVLKITRKVILQMALFLNLSSYKIFET
jgi:hypothetical protein